MIDTTSPQASKYYYQDALQIENLVQAFEERTLPFTSWTHEAHITIAYWYLTQFDLPTATGRIRNGIQAYNLANGVAQTPTRGYHETITLFYIWAIGKFLAENPVRPSALEMVNKLLATPCSSRLFPFEFYSRERLFSWEARTGWLEPDLQPLQ
jgi:hypothetical protein